MWDGHDRNRVGIAEDSLVEGRAGRDGGRDDVEGEGGGGGVAVAVDVVGAVAMVGLVGGEGSRQGRPWMDMALVHQTEEEETKVVGRRTLVVEQGYLFLVVAGC